MGKCGKEKIVLKFTIFIFLYNLQFKELSLLFITSHDLLHSH